MTVKELRQLLHKANPDAEIYVSDDNAETYRITGVQHTNNVDQNGNPVQHIDIWINKERK